MRLIDADALEELFREVIGNIAKKQVMNGNLEHMVRASAMTIEMIKDASTIEPEQKTGNWKEVYAESDYRNGWIEFTCENCEYQHGLESGQYGWHYGDDIPWKYCPICGAKMEV